MDNQIIMPCSAEIYQSQPEKTTKLSPTSSSCTSHYLVSTSSLLICVVLARFTVFKKIHVEDHDFSKLTCFSKIKAKVKRYGGRAAAYSDL